MPEQASCQGLYCSCKQSLTWSSYVVCRFMFVPVAAEGEQFYAVFAFMETEAMDGDLWGALAEECREYGSDRAEVQLTLLQVAEGLHGLQTQGVLHR